MPLRLPRIEVWLIPGTDDVSIYSWLSNGDRDPTKFMSNPSGVTDAFRQNMQYTALETEFNLGVALYVWDTTNNTYHAYNPDFYDSVGPPVVTAVEEWMWGFHPFLTDGTRAVRKIAVDAPEVSDSHVIPSGFIFRHTELNDQQAIADDEFRIQPPFTWKLDVDGTDIAIDRIIVHRVESGSPQHQLEVTQTDDEMNLEGYRVTLVQGTLNVTGTLDNTNRYINAGLATFSSTVQVTVRIEPPAAGATAVVGTVGIVQNATTKPTTPTVPTGSDLSNFRWSQSLERLVNLPTDWYRIGDSSKPALTSGEVEWFSWSWVDRQGNIGVFSEPSYGGTEAVQYTTDETPGTDSTWTTTATGAKFLRLYGPNGWSTAIPLDPKPTVKWQEVATIHQSPTNTTTTVTRQPTTPTSIDLDTITEFKIRWRRLNATSGDIEFVRESKAVSIQELKRGALQDYTGSVPASAIGTNERGCLYMYGWTNGTYTDLIPYHANTNLATSASPDFDGAAMFSFQRPDGANGENKLGQFILRGVSSPVRRAYFDLLVR